jgi:hypothetical protein
MTDPRSNRGQLVTLGHIGCRDLLIYCESGRCHHRVLPTFTSRRISARCLSRRECDGFLVALSLGHHRPRHPRDLVGERDRSDFRWLALQQCCEPGPMFAAMSLSLSIGTATKVRIPPSSTAYMRKSGTTVKASMATVATNRTIHSMA